MYFSSNTRLFQSKNKTHERNYALNIFNLSANIAKKKDKYDNYLSHNYKKLLIIFDKYQSKKSFLYDFIDSKKKTNFRKIDVPLSNNVYLQGYFESEKYFIDIKNELIKQFKIKENFINKNNKYINLLNETNSVSIHIRRNRFVEPKPPSPLPP